MHLYSKKVLALVAAATLALPLVGQAASLTTDQINQILGLLQSFNVDAQTVGNVKAALTNTPPPPRRHDDEDDDRNATSTQGHDDRQKPPLPPGQAVKCVALMRNIAPGMKGEDVRELQKFLKEDDDADFTGSTTGFFGPKTMEAMKRFQMANAIASTSTGTVGPRTREFFEMRCRKEKGDKEVRQVPPPTPVPATTNTAR